MELKVLIFLLFIGPIIVAARIWGNSAKALWEPDNGPLVKNKVFNQAKHDELPKVTTNARFVDLVHGLEFDDIQRDTPDELRPPALVFFYGYESCPNALAEYNFKQNAERVLPSRERLAIYRYDMDAAPYRAWYKFTPEMDLKKRFQVKNCPTVVFVPRNCSGWTKWCTKKPTDEALGDVTVVGCENFEEQCKGFRHHTGSSKDWIEWLQKEIKNEGEAQISPFLRTYKEQGLWLQQRQSTTEDNHIRNLFLAEAFPAFTDTGYKPMKTPKEVQDWFIDFWNRRKKLRKTESWHGELTQMSFHEVPSTFVDTDIERMEKERIANTYIKPILEEWSGIAPLELTSFYGLREYHADSWLAPHIDRIDTHVLSVTFSIGKLDPKTMELIPDDSEMTPWPLEVTTFYNGEIVRYNHRAGTMVLYESSKLIHGRPYGNPKDGGVHLSGFVHYKPVNRIGTEAKAWEAQAEKARQNVKRATVNSYWVSSPSVEPENPVFSKKNYGAGSIWKHVGENRAEGDDEDDEDSPRDHQFTVEFQNKADRQLDVSWDGGEDVGVVFQASLSPGMKYSVGTYEFHKFIWSEVGEQVPVVGGRFTIEKGKTLYTYAIKKGSKIEAEVK